MKAAIPHTAKGNPHITKHRFHKKTCVCQVTMIRRQMKLPDLHAAILLLQVKLSYFLVKMSCPKA